MGMSLTKSLNNFFLKTQFFLKCDEYNFNDSIRTANEIDIHRLKRKKKSTLKEFEDKTTLKNE